MPTGIKLAEVKNTESHVKLAAPELPADIRTGGENLPLPYPHLYQIQAGDWRISYAVENNRLAILVLEVLNAVGESSKDAAREKMTRKMKIKLLDWPEGVGNRQVPPEVVSNKMKIKWLDLADDGEAGQPDNAAPKSRIKLKGSTEKKAAAPKSNGSSRITLLDGTEPPSADEQESEPTEGEVIDATAEDSRKVTPLDEPSM